MKKLIIGLAVLTGFVLISSRSISVTTSSKKIASVKIKNIKGKTVNTKDFHNNGNPFIINFWATWCKPCIIELNNINDVYEEWQEETGVKLIAVSIDDSRNSRKVAPFVHGRGWTYEVYLDVNSDFRRAMGVNNPPHTLLCNGKGIIVWEHNGYAPGDEEELFKQVKKLVNKNRIPN